MRIPALSRAAFMAAQTIVILGLVLSFGIFGPGRQKGRERGVCPSGCDYYRVTDALASFTDHSATRRYDIFLGEGDYDELVTVKSYTWIHGVNRAGVRVRGNANYGITVPAGTVESGVENVTIGSFVPINGGTGAGATRFHIYNSIIGIVDGTWNPISQISRDGIYDTGTGGNIWYSSGNLYRSVNDYFRNSTNSTVYSNADMFETISTATADDLHLTIDTAGTCGQQWYINGASVNWNTDNTGKIYGVYHVAPAGGCTRPTIISITNSTIKANLSGVTANDAACVFFGNVQANALTSQVILDGTTCEINDTGGTRTLEGMNFSQTDADLATWIATWNTGRLRLTGAGAKTDIINTADIAGFQIQIGALDHTGVYSGAGVGRIFPAPGTLPPTSDLTVGSCTAGPLALDAGGATKEFCICGTANSWSCWKLTTGAFTAGGPAD